MAPTVFAAVLWMLAQDPSPPAPPAAAPKPSAEALTVAIEEATADLAQLAPRRQQLPPERWREAEGKLTEAVHAFGADPTILEWDHVARCIQATWQTQCAGACALLCDLALQRFEPTAALHAQLGMCKLTLAEQADIAFECRRLAAEAAAAFAASRELGEEQPAFVLMNQALVSSLSYDAALADLDRVLAHPKFGPRLAPAAHRIRAMYLLLAGRAAAAVAEHEAAVTAKEEPEPPAPRIRALALAGRKEDAIAKARALWRDEPTPTHLTVLADVLAFAGQYDEALKLSRDNPVERGEHEADLFLELQRTRAAFELLVELRGKRPDDLRERLRKVLGHEVRIGSLDSVATVCSGLGVPLAQPAGTRETVVDTSPLPVGSWMLRQPMGPASWANDVLFAACVAEAPTWKAGPLERGLLERLLPKEHVLAMTGADALPRAEALVRSHLMYDHAEGVLTAMQLLGL